LPDRFLTGEFMNNQKVLSIEKLSGDIKKALEARMPGSDGVYSLEQLCVVQFRVEDGNMGLATSRILEDTIQILEKSSAQHAEYLRKRFQEGQKIGTLAARFNMSDASIYRLQNSAIEELAKIILQLEMEALRERQTVLLARLEAPTYSYLVGAEKHIATLASLLQSDDAPWILSIEGIGGIGKTALADALMRQMIQQPYQQEIGWVTSRQKILSLGGEIIDLEQASATVDNLVMKLADQLWENASGRPSSPKEAIQALEYRLHKTPHIVVIDNLEAIDEVEKLLPIIRRLSNPSKFLLTTRESLYSEADIFHFVVPPLSEQDSIIFVRREAQSRNLSVLTNFSDAELTPIFQTVGGNPLALRLLVGQIHFRPLQVVLSDLLEARGQKAENLYKYVFQTAWENLDSLSQDVLLAMPLVPPTGETQDFVTAVTGLPEEEVMESLDKLIALNLVDCRQEKSRYRYSIHSLTRSFLHKEAIKWKINPL